MFKRQIEKGLLDQWHRSIQPASDGLCGNCQCFGVGDVGLGGVAEDVARELIEKEDEGKSSCRSFGPGIEGWGGAGKGDEGAE